MYLNDLKAAKIEGWMNTTSKEKEIEWSHSKVYPGLGNQMPMSSAQLFIEICISKSLQTFTVE